MISADEELVSDWLVRLEELASEAVVADFESLLEADEVLQKGVASRPDLSDELRRQFAALREMAYYLPGTDADDGADWSTIPGYTIEAELGRGGMGIVFQRHEAGLDRQVAVKVLIAGRFAHSSLLDRFRREAAIVARMQHPNIVQVYHVGQAEGTPFIVLELLSGRNLAQRIAGRPQPERYAAELVQILAIAVSHAHEQGVVHRDLKPSNVLFTASNEPKIADFGLAKFQVDTAELTHTGDAPGTPSYMAPEQVRGVVSPQIDVYALGAILYEVLTGGPPFLAETSAQTLALVESQEPKRPTRRRPRLSRDLETICLKCLQKNPHRRYATAADLAADLRRFIAGQSIMARPAGPVRRIWKSVRAAH